MPLSEILVNVLFYVFAAGAVAGAFAVAAGRNIVRSAFALLGVLCSVAALYALMKADFIAAAQVLIYVGGILVLIVFAVMLTHRIADVRLSNESAPGPAAFFACLCLLFSLAVVVLSCRAWSRGPEVIPAKAGDVEMELFQFQADGRTPVARGGGTFERKVVLAAKVERRPGDAREVEVEAAASPGWEKPVRGSARPDPQGRIRIGLEGLPEGPCHWRARLAGSGGAATPWTAPLKFTVNAGVTGPVARALMGPQLLAFEVVSMLLLAALVGAAFLARKEARE